MLNRRLIRIKVFKVLFGRIVSESDSLRAAEEELMNSCNKTVELYYYMLNCALAVRKYAEEKIDSGMKKFYPTEEERNPNRRFVDMEFFRILEDNAVFADYCNKRGLLWTIEERPLVRNIYVSMLESDYYKEFMTGGPVSRETEIKFLSSFFASEFEDNELLENMLEDMSPLWIDDLGYVLNQIIRNLKHVYGSGREWLPSGAFVESRTMEDGGKYSENDEQFAKKLLRESLLRYPTIKGSVSEMISNWDKERLVFADMLLICMGVTEALVFPSIPVKVTINEYVEISKYYSTVNSKHFVNGILDRVLKKMVAEGSIAKSGMGLIES